MSEAEVVTVDDVDAEFCTALPGLEHDFVPYEAGSHALVILRCLWCHVRACGSPNEADPCIEPFHHEGIHRSKAGTRWKSERPNRVGDMRL